MADGHRGGAVSFGLTNSYITVPNKNELNPPRLTLAVWIKTSYKDQVWRRILDKQWDNGFAVSIGGLVNNDARSNGRATLEINKHFCASDAVICDGQWHHLVGTYDSTQQKLYVDGILQRAKPSWNGELAVNSNDLTIGANRSNPEASLGEVGASFNGMMDDVMMFNRALSADEVQALFKSQGGALGPQPARPMRPQPAATQGNTNADNLKYGLYIHFGMDTFRQAGEKEPLPVERFAPASVNVKAWAHAAKEAGMTFAILTAKHESGFCLWDSKDYDYDIAHSPFKGDIISDFIAACKAEGILPGLHYSIYDTHNAGANSQQGGVSPAYFNVIKQHLTELNTRYAEIRILDPRRLSPALARPV